MMMNKTMLSMGRVATSKSAGFSLVRAGFSTSSGEKFSDRMKKTGRPLAPHVMHYAWPVAAISSITNRVTGAGLSFGIAGAGCFALVGGDVAGLMSCIGNSGVGPAAKFVVAFPFVYHYLGGVRHLVWDFYPETVNNEQCSASSYALGGAALLASAGLAATTF